MGKNFLQKGMRYSLLVVMFFITFAMANAQPGTGTTPPDSSSNDMRMMYFNIETNHTLEMNYGFLAESLLWDSISISVNYQLSYESPISSEQFLQPTGMTITNYGKVSWTPTVAGRYYFAVTAYKISGFPDEITIGNIVTVTPGEAQRCGTILGQISAPVGFDSLGFRANLQIMAISTQTPSFQPYYGDLSPNGSYRIRVPEGEYKVAMQFMNTVKYYDNASTYEAAEVLTLACHDTVIANMTITAQDIPNMVYFTSRPSTYELDQNQTATYDANAASTNGSTVRFRIFNSFVDVDQNVIASIIPETGVATFSSAVRGQHSFVIEAYVNGDSNAVNFQTVYFWVRGNTTPIDSLLCTNIYGTVTNSVSANDSANIRIRGTVYALPLTLTDSTVWGTKLNPFQAEIRANGTYTLKVPAGSYKILFNALGFASEYYNNTQNYETAETIIVNCGDSLMINAELTAQETPNIVYFTTQPRGYELNANEVGTYDADAVSTDGGVVSFRIVDSDQNFIVNINPETGVSTFSSAISGPHTFVIEAYVNGDSNATEYQKVNFWVRKTQVPMDSLLCARIYGRVTNSITVNDSSNLRLRGMVYALPLTITDSTIWANGFNPFQAEIKANGSYTLKVPAGSYKILFNAAGYESEYYNNTQNYDAAETLIVACGDSLMINAELSAYVPPTMFTLSGRVFNETNNEGVRALVRLILNDDFADSTGTNNLKRVITIENRQDGTYSIQLPEGTSFKAYAAPMKENLYLGEYYNNTYNVEDAELITITANRSGIDFGLTHRNTDSVSRFNISGKVIDENNTNTLAMVTLIRKPSPDASNSNQNDYRFYNMPTDETGNYNFQNVKKGSYILFAMPINRPLLPGFFVAASPATWNWEEATVIEVPEENGSMPTVQYNISLRNIADSIGIGRVAGKIEQSFGKVAAFRKLGNGTGISGVLVTAYDAYSRPVKYAYTDDKGEFNFDKLGFGEFTLAASKIGFGSKTTVVKIDAQNLATTSSLYLEAKSDDNSGIENNQISNVSIYPNPVQTLTNLSFQATDGNVTITITDVQGREIITMYKAVVNGINTIAIDASELTSGIYSVKVNGNNLNIQTLMNVIK